MSEKNKHPLTTSACSIVFLDLSNPSCDPDTPGP